MQIWTSLRTSKSWKDLKKPLGTILHPLVHIASAVPLLVGLWDFWQRNLGANPIQEITHRTGKTAILLLILSLAISPLRLLLKWNQLNKLRRPLGLWAAFYAGVHFSIYVVLDYGFQWNALLANSLTNKFILLGFTTGVLLLLLSITSLTYFQKKIGKNWKKLHRFVYAAGILAALHFILAVKPGVLRPWPYALVIALLLLFRLPLVQDWVKKNI
ncbi:MAG: ferric reductase-like transmembrane domain-containing protein [Anaerolineales bacterium]|nr:ferric reductase-like transmembrane domain-containing protein [Anaerolineales bacterium]